MKYLLEKNVKYSDYELMTEEKKQEEEEEFPEEEEE